MGTKTAAVNGSTYTLVTGHKVYGVQFHEGGHGTGWLAGCLYVTHDGGETWQPSTLRFTTG